jgi:hypothetical protein
MTVNKELEKMWKEEMAVGHYTSSSVGVEMVYRLDSCGLIPSGGKIFLFSKASKPTVGPTQPPIQWVLGCSFSGGKVAGA